MSINKYKEVVREVVTYRDTKDIFADIIALDEEEKVLRKSLMELLGKGETTIEICGDEVDEGKNR